MHTVLSTAPQGTDGIMSRASSLTGGCSSCSVTGPGFSVSRACPGTCR